MKTRRSLLALLLATPGCLWIQSTATEVAPREIDRPAPGDGGVPGTTAGGTGAGPTATSAEPAIANLPKVAERDWQPIDPLIVLVPGGMRVAAARWPGQGTAHIRLTIPHRQLSMARSGIARLTAELIVDAPLDDGARPSLRRMLEVLGGELEIDADGATTTFALTVPGYLWPRAVEHLAAALAAAPASRERVDATRTKIVQELGDRWFRDPLEAAVDRVTTFEFAGLPEWLTRLEDARIADVVAHYLENYRAPCALLTITEPDAPADEAVATVQTAFARWIAASDATLPEPSPSVPSAGGVFWSAAGAEPSISVVFDLEPGTVADAAASRILVECLVGSSVDGRLPDEIAQLPSAPRLALRVTSAGARQRVELSGTGTEVEVDGVRRAFARALQSLRTSPPGDEEIRRAQARARLRLELEVGEPAGWAAEVTRNMLGGALADRILDRSGKQIEVPGADPLGALSKALAQPDRIDLKPAIERLVKRGGLVVALGVDLGTNPTFAKMPDAVIPPERRAVAVADLADQEQRASAVLELACRAAGGRPALAGFAGFQARSTRSSGRGPEVVDHEWYRQDGRYRRVRHVLASTIETVVDPKGAQESCDGERITLAETDARLELDAAQRHPLVLLADWARGASRYRQASERQFDGRTVAVLERVDGDPGRIRIYVDAGSGLIRAVIAREDRPTGVVWVREEWRDYRAAERGLRAPHHRTSWIDDGISGVITRFADVTAIAPDEAWLQPGGPTR